MIDELFAAEIEQYGVTVLEHQDIQNETFLLAYPFGGYRLKVRHDLYGPRKIVAVAVQLGRIALGHDFQRSSWKDERSERREWRAALCWAAERLISGRLMSHASRLEWSAWELANFAGVTEALAWVRFQQWTEIQGAVVRFPRQVKRLAEASGWCEDSL